MESGGGSGDIAPPEADGILAFEYNFLTKFYSNLLLPAMLLITN